MKKDVVQMMNTSTSFGGLSNIITFSPSLRLFNSNLAYTYQGCYDDTHRYGCYSNNDDVFDNVWLYITGGQVHSVSKFHKFSTELFIFFSWQFG